MYDTIINPITNRKCSIYNNLGKKILQNYLQILPYPVIYGGAESKSVEPTYLKRVLKYSNSKGKHPDNIQKKIIKLVEEFNKKLVPEDFFELQCLPDRKDLWVTANNNFVIYIFFPKPGSIFTLEPEIYLESLTEEEDLLFHERWFQVNFKEGEYWNPANNLVDIFEKLEVGKQRYKSKGLVKSIVEAEFPYNLIVIDKSLGNLENLNQVAISLSDHIELKSLDNIILRNDKLTLVSEPYINPFHIPTGYHEDGHQYDEYQQSGIFIDYLFSLIFYFTYYNAYDITYIQSGKKRKHPVIDVLKTRNNLHNFVYQLFQYKPNVEKIDSVKANKIFNILQYIYKFGLLYQQIKIIEEKKGPAYFCVIASILAKIVNIYVGEILYRIFTYCKHHGIVVSDTLHNHEGIVSLYNILEQTVYSLSENIDYHVEKELFEISEDFLEQIYQNARAIPENELLIPSI